MKEDPASLMEAIEEAFQFYDTKGDSKIAASQIGNCLRSLQLQPTEGLIERMTQQWKDQPDARVSMEEFAPIYKNVKKEAGKPHTAEEFQSLLSHFDREGSGIIMLPDLRYMLQNSGERMTGRDVDLLLSHIEINEGKVPIVDFVRMVMS
ncbi:Myosin-2 essential light chain [Trichostrongylus colubriformis]|uniref:Myosin-2 essential light chain n=1 Tax=Trichostrongylus colubriformis TaxID=6319 RepID=A0AAN8FT82_TRICO